ncbi:MAG TPA: tol-pal system protein YbgF [Terriglobales bacterium]|nr:tol-pal system protein YbgF [Terriglobales bacterium]
MKTRTITLLLVLGFALAAPRSFAANKDMVALQTMVQNLQTQMQQLQQSIDERMGVMKNLVEQSADNVNKMAVTVNNLQAALDKQLQQQQQTTGAKVDQVSTQMQALNDSVDELKARLATATKQLSDLNEKLQTIQAPPTQSPGAMPQQQPQAAAPVQAPPPDVLYNNALRDYNTAKYDLAGQEFGQFMKFYPQHELAGNAQFYLADIEYQQKNYEAAVADYDKVLEQYPSGNKTPTAELKKGFALIELGQRDAGVRELRTLIARYPRSIEATQAQDRLRRLNSPAAHATNSRRRDQ